MKFEEKLQEIFQSIELTDKGIIDLVNRRANLMTQLSAIRSNGSMSLNKPLDEEKVLARLVDQNLGPLSQGAVVRLFREILQLSQPQQERLHLDS